MGILIGRGWGPPGGWPGLSLALGVEHGRVHFEIRYHARCSRSGLVSQHSSREATREALCNEQPQNAAGSAPLRAPLPALFNDFPGGPHLQAAHTPVPWLLADSVGRPRPLMPCPGGDGSGSLVPAALPGDLSNLTCGTCSVLLCFIHH